MTDTVNEFARWWILDPDVTFLNHGSFGACPRPVLEAQSALRARMERRPVQFLARELEGLLDEARAELAVFVGADPDDLAWVANATTGVNAVLRSLELGAGDELLTTDHAYNACRNTLDRVAAAAGANVVVVDVPFPVASGDVVVEAVLAGATPRTRLALIDHVTSPTGLVLPVSRIVAALADLGVDTLVDGAHAPGMLDLDVGAIGAAFYTGNCHKWICAPKGAAFLHVRRDLQSRVRPTVTSHGATADRPPRSRFLLEFDWTGTDDPTAALSVPAALRFMGALLPGGWPELRRRNRRLALAARTVLCRALAIEPPSPESTIGTLVALPLPLSAAPAGRAISPLDTDPLQHELFERWAIEVPVMTALRPPRRLLRVSAQIYNDESQYERLADALTDLLAPSR